MFSRSIFPLNSNKQNFNKNTISIEIFLIKNEKTVVRQKIVEQKKISLKQTDPHKLIREIQSLSENVR